MIPNDSSTLIIEAEDPNGGAARFLIEALCTELSGRYGAPPSPFSPTGASALRAVFLVARLAGEPAGCGALRQIDDATAEIKRMYVAPAGRRRGIARRIIHELEKNAAGFGYRSIRLETGLRQPEAISLYETCGYRRIPAYEPYTDNPFSVCFEKTL